MDWQAILANIDKEMNECRWKSLNKLFHVRYAGKS